MYSTDAQFDNRKLMQGDIITGVHILGAINPGAIEYIASNDRKVVGWAIRQEPKYADAVILSHSCEIDPANEMKMTSIILAPIRDVNTATEKDKVNDLIKSNLIVGDTKASFLKYFYLPPHPKLTCSSGAIVDFSKLFSVRKNYYRDLLNKKIIQIDSSISEKMALKLSLYFFRTHQVKATG